ncbi:tripartite tricarboxylate transporter substrate binding protein [Alteromonas aestuariivivens]|uniref:Tripartite tricarboxylate transporter substrate binding protein n=1 Tax=Alteromonas aestuariivivens TaxID=1938339 RepID=A0A3D8MEG7_9ALTE|nr:tripartite tricarboxylate transporter substrate binding protein [Alteromonas aestuariivivens]RDV29142.1 tripartite tricarboxylate transporter substrate binding protein [Alteromonas aestuariivivens]
MKKIILPALIMASVIATLAHAARPYPVRPITNTVVWSAGGGTDAVNRMIMAEMAKVLDTRINVVNKTGGIAGSIGMNSVLSKRPDGYNLVGISSSNVVAAVNGGWNERFDVWSPFIVGSSPDVISVNTDSPITSLQDLVAHQAQSQQAYKAGAGGTGGIHHLYLLELARVSGVDFQFVPYPGSAPSQTAAITGEVDVVITSMAEQAQLIRGGKLRPLAMLHPEPFELEGVGTIPSAFGLYPELAEHLPLSQAIGFAVHQNAPDDVKTKLGKAFEAAMQSPVVKQWARDNYYQLSGKHGEAARDEFAALESYFTWTLQGLGSNKFSPDKFGIPKP